MAIVITGVAGFIGSHLANNLLNSGELVLGIDNINSYYDINLKKARLEDLYKHKNFTFIKKNIADDDLYNSLKQYKNIKSIIHLAAQAGVRHSLTHPFDYVESNLIGHVRILELARSIDGLDKLIYASSSSVYGKNKKLPFAVDDKVDNPISLYAATKKSDELMSYAYSHLYNIPQIGLRFFTVYGPWGRPDMAVYIFTKAINEGFPIRVFNHGEMSRDFTFIDDIINGITASLKLSIHSSETPHRIYNLGNDKSEKLMDLIKLIENSLGKKAECLYEPIQPGDVKETKADISSSRKDLGFSPSTSLNEGVPRFVKWYKEFYEG
ncbi:GDP-mannose 4,6-dehydratase [Alphaproteobacteria bacterium]|nr:GDP-mannose 4,6-dehydratase [Alphaproteobacteria bacterium]